MLYEVHVCAHCTERRIAYFVLAYIYSFSSFLFFSYRIYYDTKYIYIFYRACFNNKITLENNKS